MPLTPEALSTNTETQERLGDTCDFEVATDPHEPAAFTVEGAEGIHRIGRDGAGGEFVLLSGSRGVLYISSEGQAGIVAADFEELIALFVACPYWRDILKFSGNGKLAEMRRAAVALERMYGDEELEEARAFLKAELGLPDPDDPVGALYRAVSTSEVVVRGPDGPHLSLFNSFTVDNNRFLRDFLSD